MSISWAIGNAVLAPRVYQNWVEVIGASFKKHEPDKVILKNGLTIQAEAALRFLVREIFFKKVYTPDYLPIEGNDIVIDIGANCGVFTLFAATTTRNAVYAFEPAPRNLAVLRHNVAVNGLHNVTVQDCAVSDKIGTAQLFLNLECGGQNLLSEHILPDKIEQYKDRDDLNYLISGPDKAEAHIEVPTTTLQEIMDSNKLERVDFLKLDCEGAESTILQSTPESYLKRIRKIAMEFHDHLTELHHSDIQKLLERAGFTTKLAWDGHLPLGYIYAWRS